MATLKQLGSLPPITLELDTFDYVPLDSSRRPPSVELLARLARGDDAEEEDDGAGLRLAFVVGHPIESDDLLVLSYLWRAGAKGVAWGVERWPSPERRLQLYRHDSSFEPRPAADVHAELQRLDPAAFADYVRGLLT
jgi:hypothetical protein